MNFAGLDVDALIALGFVGMLLAITGGLFAFLMVKNSKTHGEK